MEDRLEEITQTHKKDYQCDIRRRCSCGGHLRRFETVKRKEFEFYCSTCHKIHIFRDTQLKV